VVIGAFRVAVTRSEGGCNYGRSKRGGGSLGAPWRGRRMGRRPWHGGVRGGGGGGARPVR
jgi:hypothetical protein